MKRARQALLLAFSLTVFPAGVFGWTDWRTLKTEHFIVFYKPGYESQAWDALRALEYYRPWMGKFAGDQPFRPLRIVIEDRGTMSNDAGYHLSFIYPPPGLHGSESVTNRWAGVGVHEYIRTLYFSKAAGVPKFLTALLRNRLSSHIWLPSWMAEGIAVYGGSQISEFRGWLNDGFFDAYIGASVKDNRLPPLLKATYSPMEYPGYTGIYLYGGEFLNYLSKVYGEEKLAQFFSACRSSMLSFFSPIFPFITLDRAAKNVYGRSFPLLWQEWHKYEAERFKDFAMEGEKLTSYGWDMANLSIYDGKLYYKRRYPVKTDALSSFQFEEIIERDLSTGKERAMVSHISFFTMPMRLRDGKLYYAVAEIKFGYANISSLGFYSIIHEKDLSTGKGKVVFAEEMRAFDVLPAGDILYSKDRKGAFGSTIYLYERATKENRLLFTMDYLVDEIISNGKRVIVSARKDWENFSLYTLSLETGELSPLVHTPYLEGGISLHRDKLFFNANYEKRISAYCYDFSTDKVYRLTENGFATFPAYDEKENMLYFVGLNSYGNDLYRKPAEFKEFQIPFPSNPSFVPVWTLKESEVRQGGYLDNLKTLMPKILFPQFSFGRDMLAAGALLMGADVIGHWEYGAQFLYDFKRKKLGFSINLSNNFFVPLRVSIKYRAIKERSLKLEVERPLIWRLSPELSGIYLGTNLNFFKDLSRREIESFLITSFRYPKGYGGLKFRLPIERKELGSSIERTGCYIEMDLTRYLPNSKISLKVQGIVDTHNPDTVFPKIRGYGQPLDAKRGVVFTLEYSRPILQIRNGFWNPNIFFEDLAVNLFVDGAAPNGGRSQVSTGVELHLETKALFKLSFDIGVGLAVNREKGRTPIFCIESSW